MAIQQISSLAAYAAQETGAPRRPAAVKEPAPAEVHLPDQAASQPSPEQVRQAIEAVKAAVEPVARDLQFTVDKETGKTIISVVDSATREVIRQIPGEEIVAIAKAIDRMKSLLFKQTA